MEPTPHEHDHLHHEAIAAADKDILTAWKCDLERREALPFSEIADVINGLFGASFQPDSESFAIMTSAFRCIAPAPSRDLFLQLAIAAKREEKLASDFEEAYFRHAVRVGLLTETEALDRRKAGRLWPQPGRAWAVIYHLFRMGPAGKHIAAQRLDKELEGYEVQHLLAALVVVWAGEALVAIRNGAHSKAFEKIAGAGVLLGFLTMSSTMRQDALERKGELARRAREMANAKHAEAKSVRERIIAMYSDGNFKNPSHASHELSTVALRLSREAGKPLSPYNVQKTVYQWLLAARKSRSVC